VLEVGSVVGQEGRKGVGFFWGFGEGRPRGGEKGETGRELGGGEAGVFEFDEGNHGIHEVCEVI